MACDRCSTAGLAEAFGERRSKRDARRFRRRGLDLRAQRLLDAIAAAVTLDGATVLDVGAGIGAASLTLLERGAARAHAVEAAPAAAKLAQELAEERGVVSRLSVEVGDFAQRRGGDQYDIVVMDRVVCCYGHWQQLLAAAARAARTVVALSYPREVWYNKVLGVVVNGVHKLIRRDFRFYVHPPHAMHALLHAAGLRPEVIGRDGPWELALAKRQPQTSTNI